MSENHAWHLAGLFLLRNNSKITNSDNLAYVFVADLLESLYFFEILETSFTVKDSGNVVKSGSFEKRLQEKAPIFFRNDRDIKSFLCKNVNVLVYY